jgi:hypothetical protein
MAARPSGTAERQYLFATRRPVEIAILGEA